MLFGFLAFLVICGSGQLLLAFVGILLTATGHQGIDLCAAAPRYHAEPRLSVRQCLLHLLQLSQQLLELPEGDFSIFVFIQEPAHAVADRLYSESTA